MNPVSTTAAPSLSGDRFIEQFFSRLPEGMHADFTDHQLAALKSVFGEATRSGHGFDIRLSFPTPLFGRGVYLVLLGGRDRRGSQAGHRFPARRGWRGLANLGIQVVGALFVIQLLIAAIILAIWLL